MAARLFIWGCSSVGRAPALQAGGHEFESHHLHFLRMTSGGTRKAAKQLSEQIAQQSAIGTLKTEYSKANIESILKRVCTIPSKIGT